MKWIYYSILLVYISVITINCQKEVNYVGGNPPGTGNTNKNPISATLQGNVLNESGRPAIGVSVKVGTKTATTNAYGYFRIVNAPLDKNTSLVTAEKAGYFKAIRVFGATSGVNQVVIQLIKKTSAGTVNATSGGTVTLNNGSKIALPANGVIKTSGGAYSGSIKVNVAYIDPTSPDIAKTVPGSFLANDKDNKRVILSSYGMLAVELESSAGEKLQIASGSKATLTMPIPASLQSSAPATISLWYVDEQTGIWKEEGTASKNGSNYVGDVKHFSYWNCDVAGPQVMLTATFKNSEGLPLVYTDVWIRPATSSAAAHGLTDSLGQICGPVPANVNLVMEVMSPCYSVMFSQNIGPFSSDVNLGTITVNPNPSSVTVKGRLLNCSGAAVSNGYAIIRYDYTTRYASVLNANGEFATTFTMCAGMPSTCEILGVDAGTQQQGAMINVSVTSPTTDAGNIVACGTSALQYINYNLDGTSHSISSLVPGDSFKAVSYDSVTNNHAAAITGYHSGNIEDIYFIFNNFGVPGIYPMAHLNLQSFSYPNYPTIIQPFNVTVTNYPVSAGGFFEGSFSGQFKDQLNVTHSISGSFRARRL